MFLVSWDLINNRAAGISMLLHRHQIIRSIVVIERILAMGMVIIAALEVSFKPVQAGLSRSN